MTALNQDHTIERYIYIGTSPTIVTFDERYRYAFIVAPPQADLLYRFSTENDFTRLSNNLKYTLEIPDDDTQMEIMMMSGQGIVKFITSLEFIKDHEAIAPPNAEPIDPEEPSPYTVAIEENGWVLAVTGNWGATVGAWEHSGADRVDGRFMDGAADQFPLDPDGTPKIVVALTSEGYARSGGEAVADPAVARTVVATKPLRKPYPNQAELDEIDHGDGTRTLRFALSDRVYEDDTLVSVTFAAGWKAGEDGGVVSGGDLTNSSDLDYPLPIVRAATLPLTLVRGATSVQADWIVATHFPSTAPATRHDPLAAVKVEATDGTDTVTTWLTGLRTSPLYGDNLRCVGGEIDLDGLSAGIVSLVATFYPWIGTARTIGSGQVADVAVPLPTSAEEPLIICYDPGNSRYPTKHVFVDPVNGTESYASVTVADTLALAKAGTAAKTVSVANTAISAANFAIPAANGMAGGNKVADGVTITLAAGVHSWGTQAAGVGYTAVEAPLIIQGDPDDPDPRNNCIFQSGGKTNPSLRNARWLFRNLTIEAGQVTFLTAAMMLTENVKVRGKSGYEAATNGVFYSSTPAGKYNQAHAGLDWAYGGNLAASGMNPGLLRTVVINKRVSGTVFIGVRTSPAYSDGTQTLFTFPSAISDQMIWGCAGYGLAGKLVGFSTTQGAGTAAEVGIFRRIAIINSVAEHATADNYNFFAIGELAYTQFEDSVWEGNSFVGQRINIHNNSSPAIVDLKHTGNVSRNNYYDRQGTKHDLFGSDGSLTGSWEWLYGVGHAGNVFGNRLGPSSVNFQYAFPGLNAAWNEDYDGGFGSNDFPKFVDDKSYYGSGGAADGYGDYTPDTGSPLLGRGRVASVDVDLAGTVRGEIFDAGAVESTAGANDPFVPDPDEEEPVGGVVFAGITVRSEPAATPVRPVAFANTIYVDLDAGTNGDGSQGAPYNSWRGYKNDPAVPRDTRVVVRGRLAADNYNTEAGSIHIWRDDEDLGWILFDGNDPDWGRCTVDSAYDVATSVCTDATDAKGSPYWEDLVYGLLPRDKAPADYSLGGFWGPDRDSARMAVYPSLPDDPWLDHNQFLPSRSMLDVFWHPAIDTEDPLFDANLSQGRLFIGVDATDAPELAAQRADLRAACRADQTPILVIRVQPNNWRCMPAYRGDDDGTPNAAGDYLISSVAGRWGGIQTYVDPNYFRMAVANLVDYVDQPGRFAYGLSDDEQAWVVGWPAAPGLGFSRSSGAIGIRITTSGTSNPLANRLGIDGFRFQGFCRKDTGTTGKQGLALTSDVKLEDVDIRNCEFGSIVGLNQRNNSHMSLSGSLNRVALRYNYFGPAEASKGLRRPGMGECRDFIIEQNVFDRVSGTNIGFSGGNADVIRLTIRDNHFIGVSDIHGNHISLYARMYGALILRNVSIGADRVLTSQCDGNYDPDFGTPYTYLSDNVFITGTGGQYVIWPNKSVVRNVLVDGGFYASPDYHYAYAAGQALTDMVIKNATLVRPVAGGGTSIEAKAELDPSNTLLDADSVDGQNAIAAHSNDVPDVPVGPMNRAA